MKNMAFVTVGDLVVALHNSSPPTEQEWAGYMDAMKKIGAEKVRGLAFTDGGGPDSKQRKLITDLLGGQPRQAAVVSASSVVRGIVTALNWFNPAIKAFSPERVDEAYDYLKLTTAEIEAVNRQVRVMHKQFSTPLRCVPA